jgi:pilus assembly protein HofM
MVFSQTWQVGLDIQGNTVRALAAQRRRGGWQLRHWWQQELPQTVLRDGYLDQSEILINALRQWRVRLPRNISLRIALPAQRVLQSQMAVPDGRLQEPARNRYITTQGLKQFPLDSQTLALDYRSCELNVTQLLLTAARQQELQQWLNCLQQADLHPQVVDITPCALRSMACAAGLSSDAGLLHRLEEEWLWVAPDAVPFSYGLLRCDEFEDVTQALAALHIACPAMGQQAVYYSSVLDETISEGLQTWTPFSAFRHLQPPLPSLPAAFVVAGGLALREGDR